MKKITFSQLKKLVKEDGRKVKVDGSRAFTNALLEDAEEGILSWESIARAALDYMSENDVRDMAESDFEYEEDDGSDDEDEEEAMDKNDIPLRVADKVLAVNPGTGKIDLFEVDDIDGDEVQLSNDFNQSILDHSAPTVKASDCEWLSDDDADKWLEDTGSKTKANESGRKLTKKQVLDKIDKYLTNYENRFPSFFGVRCSRADLEEIKMRLERPDGGYMPPVAEVKEVMDMVEPDIMFEDAPGGETMEVVIPVTFDATFDVTASSKKEAYSKAWDELNDAMNLAFDGNGRFFSDLEEDEVRYTTIDGDEYFPGDDEEDIGDVGGDEGGEEPM